MTPDRRTAADTALFREARESADRVQSQLDRDAERVAQLAAELRRRRPRALVTCARGSSDHAATFARYLIETRLGLLTSSASPSVSSIYGARPDLSHCVFLAISQSGRSPDLLAAAAAAREAGALVLALVNDEASELAGLAELCLPLRAGPETSVAATKSFVCTLSALVHLVGHWADDGALLQALAGAPDLLARAWPLDWAPLALALVPARHLFVLGRGLGLGLAQEAALKLKETCRLHAEAYSTAEVQHGPMALFADDVPALIFCQDDEARPGIEALARELVADGVRVFLAGASVPGATMLPSLDGPAAVAPMLLAQSLYRCAAGVALARGMDPDHPARLRKVTRTL
jgi:glucosamine--fructose-6-phosphate aminotransferase (isomerizing)